VAVPRLIGMEPGCGRCSARRMKLVASPKEVESTEPGGTVVDQDPKEGEEVEPGSTVVISVSNAPS